MKKILIIDDDKTFADLYQERLKYSDYDVDLIYNGNDAIPAVREKKPDVILLDLMLPGKSGKEILTELKNDPETSDIPVFILTALSDSSVREELASKAQGFCVKSEVMPKDLIALIEKTLKAKN